MTGTFKNSLAVRFLLTTILILAAAMVLGTTVSSIITNRAMEEVARTQLKRQVDDTIGFVNTWLEAQRAQMASIGRETIYTTAFEKSPEGQAARQAAGERFARIALSAPFFYNLSLLDLSGKVLVSDLPDEDAAMLRVQDEYMNRAIRGELVVTQIVRSSIYESPVFGLYSAISVDGKPRGVLYFEYSLHPFNNLFIDDLKAGKSGFAFLLDHSFTIISHPNSKQLGNTFFQNSEYTENLKSKTPAILEYSFDGISTIAYPGRLEDLGCTLMLSVPSAEHHSASVQLIRFNVIITLNAILVCIVALLLLWRREISGPIQELLRGIRDFRSGKLDNPLQPAVTNEFNNVVRSFNAMAKNIESSTVSIQALKEQQNNLQTILDFMSIGILIIDQKGKLQMVNAALLEIFGTEWQHTDNNAIKNNQDILPDILKNLSDAPSIEKEFINSDGRWIHLLRLVTPIRLSGEDVLLVTFVDISEQKEAEKQRKLLKQDLETAGRLKAIGTLAAGVAHEINTPIQYIGDNVRFTREAVDDILSILSLYQQLINSLGDIEMTSSVRQDLNTLRNKEDEVDIEYLLEEIPPALNQALSGIEHVARIIAAMKTFSHQGEDKISTYDINDGIQNTLTISRNEWKHVADIQTYLDPELPSPSCFVGDMNQVLLNLIINAAHAIEDKLVNEPSTKGTISIRTFTEDKFVCITISDNGIGMTEETQSRVFEPFFTTKDVGKGTGQGLSLARNIVVDKHGGELLVESEFGVGSTMQIKLPLNV